MVETSLWPFLVKTLDELDGDDDDDDGGGGGGDGDVDDVDSDGDHAEICWKSIVVWSQTAPKPLSMSRIATWSLSEFVSLETYP